MTLSIHCLFHYLLFNLSVRSSLDLSFYSFISLFNNVHSITLQLLWFIFQYMLTRFPTLAPDSPWEAKAITIVRSIQDNKVIVY